ncbi:alpha-1,4-N-acetylglucosaminyltransferase-like isoform X1 [Protopterus annectens]|uniref:alpha-1,4-N-acetylglucosaminyltransferase-like isoform X1 n=1 Tax=Protopterus annectens TaxID=7888 RepID=UPI001CFAE0A4|nr:alpha-1,4-N-acetylglucosaminyltransferase-like isoform X1 [Protopterus annectens]
MKRIVFLCLFAFIFVLAALYKIDSRIGFVIHSGIWRLALQKGRILNESRGTRPHPTTTPISVLPPVMFVETTLTLKPQPLVICALESAARLYQDRPIYFFLRGLKNQTCLQNEAECPGLKLLTAFPNVQLLHLDPKVLLDGTPLATWYNEKSWAKKLRINCYEEIVVFSITVVLCKYDIQISEQSRECRRRLKCHHTMTFLRRDKVYKEPYWIQTTSDGYRLVLLWKNGGFYFDTDVISTKKIPEENFLASESSDSVSNGVLGFQKHHSYIMDCMTDFVLHYNGGIWGHQGPTLITRVVKKSCPLPHYNKVQDFRCDARNLTFLHPSRFYPIHWTAWEKYFEVWKEIPKFEDSYGLHLYNYMNNKAKKMVVAGSNTLAENLFIKYCPSTYAFLIKKVKD